MAGSRELCRLRFSVHYTKAFSVSIELQSPSDRHDFYIVLVRMENVVDFEPVHLSIQSTAINSKVLAG